MLAYHAHDLVTVHLGSVAAFAANPHRSVAVVVGPAHAFDVVGMRAGQWAGRKLSQQRAGGGSTR